MRVCARGLQVVESAATLEFFDGHGQAGRPSILTCSNDARESLRIIARVRRIQERIQREDAQDTMDEVERMDRRQLAADDPPAAEPRNVAAEPSSRTETASGDVDLEVFEGEPP